MADEGCALVQRHALVAARDCGVPLVIRALRDTHGTVVGNLSEAQEYGLGRPSGLGEKEQ